MENRILMAVLKQIWKDNELQTTFLLIFFTAARTCYCSQQKIFTRPDDCATLKFFFLVICIIRILTMKTEKSQLRGKNSVCAGAFELLRGYAPAQLRGNIDYE
jgi:hypothetical protein